MALPESDEQTVLLHNPRCSKSRATLALLEERGTRFEVREYLSDPLSREELVSLGQRLARPLGQWIRKKEAAFGEAGLSSESSDDALFDAVAERPCRAAPSRLNRTAKYPSRCRSRLNERRSTRPL